MVSAGDPSQIRNHHKHGNNMGSQHRSQRLDRSSSSSSHTDLAVIGDPYFAEDAVGVNNVTAQLGLTTYLHCKVNNLNGKTVSFNYIFFSISNSVNGAFFKANFGSFF